VSYREENGQVILTMSREDYDRVLMRLGTAGGVLSRQSFTNAQLWDELKFLNRLNEGNPNYTPYRTKERSMKYEGEITDNAETVYASGCTGLTKLDAPNAEYVDF